MWQIIHHSLKANFRPTFVRKPLLTNSNLTLNRTVNRNCFTKPVSCTLRQNSVYTFSKIAKITIVLASGTLANLSYKKWALCEAKHNRLAGYKFPSDKNLQFNWSKFWSYLKPHIWFLILAIAGALAVAILNIKIPQVMGSVINVIAEFHKSEKFLEEIRKPALNLTLLYIGQSFFTFCYISLLSMVGEKVTFSIKTDLFKSIMNQDMAFFDEHRTGEVINRLTTDLQNFKHAFKTCISNGLRCATQVVGSTVSLFFISPQMTSVTVLCVPSVIGVGTLMGAILRRLSRKAQNQVEKTTAVADEAISNVRTVRAFAMEEQEIALFSEESEKARILNTRLGFGIGLFQAGSNMFLNGMVLITVSMGGYLLSTDQLSAGQLMAYLMATQTIQRSLAQVSLLFGSLVRGMASGARILEYIDLKPGKCIKGGNVIPYHSLTGNIEFKNVDFAYPTRPQYNVLRNFNLSVPAGKTVAIVGSSGNGKSTVVALLERFYDVQEGSITIDGVDLRTLDPTWLRGRVLGIINQEPVLFGTTIKENIRYGRPDATEKEVVQAAALANAHDFIMKFPMAYDTVIGERGATLSGGQKQRVAIARALLKNPSILILDEATSALDTQSEKIVQQALENAAKGRTVLVIAHRLSTIQNADIIVVLNKGIVVEMGNHEQLIKLKGAYWNLVQQQMKTDSH